jgi:Glyoxalase-like domain
MRITAAYGRQTGDPRAGPRQRTRTSIRRDWSGPGAPGPVAMLSGMAIPIQVVFDCADPGVVAQFWAEALGYELQGPPMPTAAWLAWQDEQGVPEEHRNDASAIVDPDGSGPRIYFQRVPEPKTVKNRLHIDINASGPAGTSAEERRARVDETVEKLTALGATLVIARADYDEYYVTMLDPEGNEFDVQ